MHRSFSTSSSSHVVLVHEESYPRTCTNRHDHRYRYHHHHHHHHLSADRQEASAKWRLSIPRLFDSVTYGVRTIITRFQTTIFTFDFVQDLEGKTIGDTVLQSSLLPRVPSLSSLQIARGHCQTSILDPELPSNSCGTIP